MKFRFPRIKYSSAQEAIKFGYLDPRNWDQCNISRLCVRELPSNCWPLCGNTVQQHSEILNMSSKSFASWYSAFAQCQLRRITELYVSSSFDTVDDWNIFRTCQVNCKPSIFDWEIVDWLQIFPFDLKKIFF